MPDESNRDIRITISVTLEQAGPNPHWSYDIDVPIPPHHLDDEHEKAFIRHELDRAMTDFQRENFDYSRTARIIHQFDLRMRVIENLIKFAPHDLNRVGLATAILAVIHLDENDLLTRYASVELED